VFGLFERIKMVEKIGSGISRINDAMKEANLLNLFLKQKGFLH